MTATNRLRPKLERPRGWRWLVSGAALALAPKCILCLAIYAGVGTAFGLGGPELCGATRDAPEYLTVGLAVGGASIGLAGFLARRAKPVRHKKLDRF